MRVYLAAAWSRKDEIKKIADDLIELGVNVQARWLEEPTTSPYGIDRSTFMRERAEIDVDDVLACDILVRFSDNLCTATVPSGLATGARMFETGLAWSLRKKIIVVGGFQCVFDYLGDVRHVPDVLALKTYFIMQQRGMIQ